MEYKDYRNRIHSGDLIAWTHKGWKSFYDFQVQMVRAFTQSEYSHVGIAWRVNGRLFVLEAVVPCVRIFPLSLCESFYHIDMEQILTKPAEEFALSQIGEPYSKLLAIKSFLGMVKQGDDGSWQCAKYANEVLRANGFDCGTAFTPTTLVQAALRDGKDLRYVSK